MKFDIIGEFLPIGSVIMLKDQNKRIMIIGRLQERIEDHKIFDYCACLYPEGLLLANEIYLFNNEDITQVCFLGMQDKEEVDLQKFLENEKAHIDSI